METIENYKGYDIKVKQDSYEGESPREWDNLGKLCLFHDKYKFPNESGHNIRNFDSPNDFLKFIQEEENPAILLMVKMYSHSGISLTADPIKKMSYPYTDYFDSGTVGF